MLCYIVIYYSNITFKPTKQVLVWITISSLITVIFFTENLVYGNISPGSEINCLYTDSRKNIERYVQYIEDLLISDISREINDWNLQQGLCIEQSGLENHPFAFLPSSVYDFNDSFQLQISSHTVSKIIDFMYKPSFLFLLLTITITGITMKSLRRIETMRPKERKGFTQLIKFKVLRRQDNKCAHCRKILTVVDFHHKNGDRSDNKQSNCQALCPNCHAIETRGLLKGK